MSEQKIKITAAVATVLFFISLIFIGVTSHKNANLKADVNKEKLKTESVLAEKLKLDKQIMEFKKDLASLTGKNSDLNKYVAEVQQKLAMREDAITKLGNENNSLKKFRKEAEELRKMREQLNTEVAQLTSRNQYLETEIQGMNVTIAGLQKQNQGLNDQLTAMLSNTGANFKVEVVRKNNEKLTYKAKRTHTILVTFDMPSKEGRRNFRLDLQSPTGTNMPGELKAEIASINELSASTESNLVQGKNTITLAFTPEQKLSKGTYTMFIFDGHNYITNLQFRLSK